MNFSVNEIFNYGLEMDFIKFLCLTNYLERFLLILM